MVVSGFLQRSIVNGLLVTPGDIPELADGIQRIFEDRRLASCLSAEGLETARSRDWMLVAQEIEAVYAELLAARRGKILPPRPN